MSADLRDTTSKILDIVNVSGGIEAADFYQLEQEVFSIVEEVYEKGREAGRKQAKADNKRTANTGERDRKANLKRAGETA